VLKERERVCVCVERECVCVGCESVRETWPVCNIDPPYCVCVRNASSFWSIVLDCVCWYAWYVMRDFCCVLSSLPVR
jgi:hypothetical protein